MAASRFSLRVSSAVRSCDAFFQLGGMTLHALLEPLALGHVALNTEVAGDAPFCVVEAEVVAFDPDGRAVDPPLVGLDVEPSAIEEIAPHAATVLDIVLEQVLRRHADERLACRAVLREEGVVGLRHALMLEDVVEHALFVDRVVPADGLVEHHEKEAVQRLREEQLETIVGVDSLQSGAILARGRGYAPAAKPSDAARRECDDLVLAADGRG